MIIEKTDTLVNSCALDLIHGLTKGEALTEKHFLLGLGLHNLIVQQYVVKTVNRVKHSIRYDRICDIETTKAMKLLDLSSEVSSQLDCLC